MVRDILESAAVGKLKDILKDRYGKGLQVNFMQEVSSLDIQEDSFLLFRGNLHIPICVNDKFLATAIIENAGNLSFKDQETITQLVKMFLEPEVFTWYIEQSAHNAKAEYNDQVVSIFEPFELQHEDKTNGSTNILCLQTVNPASIPKMAQNVHETSGRWAFLKFSDIQSQVKNPSDLKSLGALTLLIDDVLHLSPEMQDIVHLTVSNASPADEPLILIACTSPIESLMKQGLLHPGLGRLMQAHCLEIERLPRDPDLLQETLEIMLEF